MSIVSVLLWLFAFEPGLALAAHSAPVAQADRPVVAAPDPPPRTVTIIRTMQAPVIDGILDDASWAAASEITGFTQREPDEGAAPSQRTVVRLLYDDDAVYVCARMHDSRPDSIVANLGRRDMTSLNSDAFYVFLDPYLDRRTGFFFGLNAAGVYYDGVMMNDDWDDDSWDGVWTGRVTRDDDGWTAEMRIPLTQLRFRNQPEQTWGVNFRRDIARRNERSYLSAPPRSESGFVSRFYDLTGIRDVKPRRQLEVLPYVTTRAELTDQPEGNPFNDGSRISPGFGVDATLGLTSNLTLNATVNPDFGQVEVDPAEVNLSDVESFFSEKRPFFIEGSNKFSFGQGGSSSSWNFNYSNPLIFYSRRIGRTPQGGTPGEMHHDGRAHDVQHTDRPDGAAILGATKLTGQLAGGWNVGTLHAVTGREHADLALEGGIERQWEIEPRTYYGVTRVQKEFAEGRQALGFVSTLALRDFASEHLRDDINRSAFVGGLDGWTFLDADRKWVVTGWGAYSDVQGSQSRIFDLQRSSAHYFQRPDADHVELDSSATSIQGWSGRAMVNKQKGNILFNAAVGAISPGFNPNDLGFNRRTDVINAHVATGYRFTEPQLWFRRYNFNAAAWTSRDFGGNLLGYGLWTGNWTQYGNFWESWWNLGYVSPRKDVRFTRGGPMVAVPAGIEGGVEIDTDSRKAFVFEFGGFFWQSSAEQFRTVYQETVWKPAANVSLVVNPRLSFGRDEYKYVTQWEDATATETFGRRYAMADLKQVTLSSSIRLNWTFTPMMTLQVYAQPLISAGKYTDFKLFQRPDSFDFMTIGQDGSVLVDADDVIVDPDGDGPAPQHEIGNQDFNFRSLRGTAVLRWEFRPGSTLFLVWTQDRSHFVDQGDFAFRRSLDDLIGEPADNIFMLKLTYWLSR